MSIARSVKRSSIKIILFSWLLVGSLDILAAFIDYYIHTGKGPEGVLRFIASGAFGSKVFSGNSIMIWLGLIFHFFNAFMFTIFFYWLYTRVKFLQYNIIVTAILYGIFIWLVMNLIIVPLSNTPKFPFNIINAIKAAVILICMIGLPLSIIMKNYLKSSAVKKY